MMILHAPSLDQISVDDVKLAALGLGVLPANMPRPEPKAQSIPEPAEIASPLTDFGPGPGLAPTPDS